MMESDECQNQSGVTRVHDAPRAQEPVLFSGSIAYNIGYGAPRACCGHRFETEVDSNYHNPYLSL